MNSSKNNWLWPRIDYFKDKLIQSIIYFLLDYLKIATLINNIFDNNGGIFDRYIENFVDW